MSSYNRVLILGTLGSVPELRRTSGGRPFCRMSLATRSPAKDGAARTSWHSVHVFGKQAEFASSHLQTGAKVLVEGRMETTESDRDGLRIWNTWVTADRVTFVSRCSESPILGQADSDHPESRD